MTNKSEKKRKILEKRLKENKGKKGNKDLGGYGPAYSGYIDKNGHMVVRI